MNKKIIKTAIIAGTVFSAGITSAVALPNLSTPQTVSAATYGNFTSTSSIGKQVLRITNPNGARRIDHNGNTVQTPLPINSEWQTNTKAVDQSGKVWYNVSDDQWVSQDDVWVKGLTYAFDNYKTYPIDEVVTVTNGSGTEIYDINGKPTGRVLPHASAWVSNVFGTDLAGNTWYCVGDNQYISSRDVSSQSHVSFNVVQKAISQVGVPYIWGGEAEGVGFDCSGLVQWSFAQAGVSLPRTSEQQATQGYPVSMDALQPGDLLFWDDNGDAYHVAIYIGNGQLVMAPQPGQTVKVQSVNAWRPDYARRVL